MEKIDFLYVAGMHGDQHVPILSDFFFNKKKSYLIVTENYADYIKWKKSAISVYFIGNRGASKPSVLSDHIAKEVGVDNIIKTEFMYYSLPKKLLQKKFFKLCDSIQELLDMYEVGFVIQKPGGEIVRRIFFNLPGIKTICFGESYFSGYSTLYVNEYKTPCSLQTEGVVTNPLELLNESLGAGKEIQYTAGLSDLTQPKIKRLKLLLRSRCYSVLYSYFSHKMKLWPFGAIRRKVAGWLYTKKIDRLKGSNKKIFYFPLNVKAESELYVRNLMLSDQANICKSLKQLLPRDSLLVVKEHPGYSKSLSLYEIYKLWRCGIFIANSDTPSSIILAQCDGVIAVSSTVLIEAIQGEKPVLVLGAWPYSKYLVGRCSENSTQNIVDFFRKPEDFLIQAQMFSNMGERYLYKGSAYSNSEEFVELLSSIVKIEEGG